MTDSRIKIDDFFRSLGGEQFCWGYKYDIPQFKKYQGFLSYVVDRKELCFKISIERDDGGLTVWSIAYTMLTFKSIKSAQNFLNGLPRK